MHEAMDVKYVCNVIKKSTNHTHYEDMSKTLKQWWIDNMRYVALQLVDEEGDVVICCTIWKNQVPRPMYLVCYLVIIHGERVDTMYVAMNTVNALLQRDRQHTLDRHRSLIPIIEHIFNYDNNNNNNNNNNNKLRALINSNVEFR